MNKNGLAAAIKKLKEQLAEIEEERGFILSQTGRHIPGHIVRDYEATIDQLQKELSHLQELLAEKEEKTNQ